MPDLSNWSYADDFMPFEAACLIVGLDPAESTEDQRVSHVMRRMEKAYEITLEEATWDVWGAPEDEDLAAYCPPYAPDQSHVPLPSLKLEASRYAWTEKGSEEIKDWLKDAKAQNFNEQRFSARVLGNWVASSGLKSAFSFVGEANQGSVSESLQTPSGTPQDHEVAISFGRHRTHLLALLADVSERYWSRYDPADPSTAPTNEMVIEWLIARGVSRSGRRNDGYDSSRGRAADRAPLIGTRATG
jgi:hypothetical protein